MALNCAGQRLGASLLWAWLSLALYPLPLLAAPDSDNANAELTELRSRIEALRERLNSARAQESSLLEQLAEVEQRISRVTRNLRTVKHKLELDTRRLDDLQTKYAAIHVELDAERKRLAQQLRAAYLLGRQEQVKLLLNQEDPARIGRVLTYYRYLNHARLARIERVEISLQRLTQLQEQIAVQRDTLAQSQRRYATEMAELGKERGEREGLLRQLRADIRDQDDQLAGLEKDEKRLQQLINEVQKALSDMRPAGPRRQPFAKLKRKLPWPVQGSLEGRFNQRRAVGDLRWRGVFIAAAANQDVRAVSNGRVAFADWLRGFGLLIIIDHGDDYMTLYGHNQSLFKEVGDWVEPGEVIASVGDTGGMAKTGLYFELRHKGEPQNPQNWCAGLPEATRVAR